jgi:ribosomal protein S16
MAVKTKFIIRLRRKGSKCAPIFEIGLSSNMISAHGSFIEVLGHLNPDRRVFLNCKRVGELLNQGVAVHPKVKLLLGKFITP